MNLGRIWCLQIGVCVLIAGGAAVLLATPTDAGAGGDKPPVSHLKPTSICLAPCGDMYKNCIAEWRHSPDVRLSIDKSPDFPAGNVLKIEKTTSGTSEIALRLSDYSGKVGLLTRFRREGIIDGEMGLSRNGKWLTYGPLSWKPSGFPIWAGHEGIIDLPNPEPTEFVFRMKGPGTIWLQQARLRSEP